MFYSYTKRFTSLSHVVLGFSLGIAPAAAWIAMRGSLDPRILWLTAAVTLWTADSTSSIPVRITTSTSQAGLFSIPRRFGIPGALWIRPRAACGDARLPGDAGASIRAGRPGCGRDRRRRRPAAVGAPLGPAHDLSRVDAAFFTMNGYVSVIFFVFWAADIFLA